MAFTDLVQWAAMCGYEYKQIIKTEHETWVVVIVDRDGSEIFAAAQQQAGAAATPADIERILAKMLT